MKVDDEGSFLEVTLPTNKSRPRTVRVTAGRRGSGSIEILGRPTGAATATEIEAKVLHILHMDEDLSAFYEVAAKDPQLSWASSGAGRMIRSLTVFEEVVKTVCTTNCSWGATKRMVEGLVGYLGEPASGAPDGSFEGRTFPTPEAMASQSESFYKEYIRSGYRGPYLIQLAEMVASGSLDLESLGSAAPDEISDEAIAEQLLALPGVGPYAAAHVMMMIGRYSRLILDSWTRPTYARLAGKKKVADKTIERRFKPYGPYAGLAFWLFVTQDW
jgi:N-glycosylase/DNA lyase